MSQYIAKISLTIHDPQRVSLLSGGSPATNSVPPTP